MATPDKSSSNQRDENVMTALFSDRDDADAAYDELVGDRFTKDDVSLAMSEETRERHYGGRDVETETRTKAAEGAGVGGAVGGTAGGVAGALAAAAAPVAFPGIGLVLAGPLAAALAGAGAGAAGGGLLGALAGLGMSEERVKKYEKGLKEGGVVVGAHPRTEEEADYVEDIFKKYNGKHIHRPETISSTSTRTTDATSTRTTKEPGTRRP